MRKFLALTTLFLFLFTISSLAYEQDDNFNNSDQNVEECQDGEDCENDATDTNEDDQGYEVLEVYTV